MLFQDYRNRQMHTALNSVQLYARTQIELLLRSIFHLTEPQIRNDLGMLMFTGEIFQGSRKLKNSK